MTNSMQQDPAERSRLMRLIYRDWRPTLIGRWVGRFMIWWRDLGLPGGVTAVLEVRSRASGHASSVPLVGATLDGEQYLVSMLGPGSNWVKNVEDAHGKAVLRHGGRRPVHLVAVPLDQRAPILREYVRVASSGRKHLPVAVDAPLSEFQAIAERYPVYRIDQPKQDAQRFEGRD